MPKLAQTVSPRAQTARKRPLTPTRMLAFSFTLSLSYSLTLCYWLARPSFKGVVKVPDLKEEWGVTIAKMKATAG